MAAIIIDHHRQRRHRAPLRLLLGSDAYQRTHQALAARLATPEAQRALAATTDVSGED
jgi:hypothetical protein